MHSQTSERPLENPNQQFTDFWAGALTPKWIRFRHLLSGGGAVHSDLAFKHIYVNPGSRIMDIGCGFGENSLELAALTGDTGHVTGIDCAPDFLAIAEQERRAAGVDNVTYAVEDIQNFRPEAGSYDMAFSRFGGVMFCENPVFALRNIRHGLRPGGILHMIVWRALSDNPSWALAEAVALRHLPPPDDDAETCGPGPFSMSNRDNNVLRLEAAGFENPRFHQQDAEVCVGRNIEEAIDYQMLVGPAGFVIRVAGDEGQAALPTIRAELTEIFAKAQRPNGEVWLPSSSLLVTADNPLS